MKHLEVPVQRPKRVEVDGELGATHSGDFDPRLKAAGIIEGVGRSLHATPARPRSTRSGRPAGGPASSPARRVALHP